MKRILNQISGISLSVALLALLGCSNFLTDSRIDPDRAPISRSTPSVEALISADVADGAITAMDEVDVSIQWSEEVEAFTVEDIDVENAVITAFSGSGRDFEFTLEIENEGAVSLAVTEGAVAGISGDTNRELDYAFVHQLSALTLSVSSTETILTNQASIPVNFSFSEDVTGFTADDVSVTNGTIVGFSGSGDSYTATLKSTADGAVSILILRGAALDGVEGIRESHPASFTITYDGSAPVPQLSTSISDGVTAGYRSLVFSVEFSEDVSGFDAGDFDIVNASLSNFSGSGDSYSIKVTPLANGPVSIGVTAGAASDTAGNLSLVSDVFEYAYDSNKIGINLSSTDSDPTNKATVLLDIEFGVGMNGFDIDDIVVSGGTAADMAGSGADYTVEISPDSDGEVVVKIPADAAISADGNGFYNVESTFSFDSDRTVPTIPGFDLLETNDNSTVTSNTTANSVLKLVLTTDYSGDGGSPLSFEYTENDGSDWNTYVNPTYLSTEKLYSGINLRVSDDAGNSATGTVISNIVIDTSVPGSPIPVIETDPSNASNEDSFNFLVTEAETDAVFSWILSSDGGGTNITGSGIIGADGTAAVNGIDVRSLGDGTLTLKVKLTDAGGNVSGWGQDAVLKDSVVPQQLNVTILSGDPITSSDNDSFSFSVSGGEEGLEWQYEISSSGGGPTITGPDSDENTFDASGTFGESSIDLSALKDGTVTVTATQTDEAENPSVEGTDSVILDAQAINIVSFPDLVDASNASATTLELIGEAGSSYNFTISSSEGGLPVTSSGLFDSSGEKQFDLDLTGLNDGYLVILVDVEDISANTAREYLVSQKNTLGPPDSGTADFSGELNSVTFDASFHGYQSVPSGYVRYDTTSIIGSSHDDTWKFSALEDGESFTLNGSSGFDTIDLTNYPSYMATISEGQVAENAGTIHIDLGSGDSVTIDYQDVERIEFSSNNFSGSPHAIELDSSDGTQWTYSDTTFELHTVTGGYYPGIIFFEGSLGLNYMLDTSFLPFQDMNNKNGLIIFDYQDSDNYKYVRAYAKMNRWAIGEVVSGTSSSLAYLDETIDETAVNYLQLRVTGVDGMTAELWSDGSLKTSYTFTDPLNDGKFGLSNDHAHTEFTINMTPSNWAPYVKNYNLAFSQDMMNELVLDIIGDAIDFEGEALMIDTLSSSSNGTLINNGDGTVTYVPNGTFLGVDIYTIAVTDGINTTIGTLRFDVMP